MAPGLYGARAFHFQQHNKPLASAALSSAPSTPSIHAFGRYSEATISNTKPNPSTLILPHFLSQQ